MADSDPDVRWMTYTEAAAILGVDRETVARRARRRRWAKQAGNDGKPRVAIPVNVLPVRASVPVTVTAIYPDTFPDNAATSTPSVPDINPPQNPNSDTAALVLALALHAQAATERADQLKLVAEAAQAEAAAARSRADRAEGEIDGLKTGAEHLHEELARMRREVAEAHNRAVTAEQQIIEATGRREGAEVALAKARSWNFLNFLFGREGKGRKP
jgi:hypothetical protein